MKHQTQDPKTDSPAIQLLKLVWQHKQEATGHSWLRLNQAMWGTLRLAIEAGIRFGLDDFKQIEEFRPGFWLDGEQFYSTAVAYRNASAWQAYERAHNRTPFIVKGAKLRNTHNYGGGRMDGDLPRLVIGTEFTWHGKRVSVTSFNDENGSLVACSYTQTAGEHCKECGMYLRGGTTRVRHRYVITHASLRAAKSSPPTSPPKDQP